MKFNRALADELGLEIEGLDNTALAAIFSGKELPSGAVPLAQAYAGHQFGGFSPQLGDGRAVLIGEVIDREGQRRDIAFKGSGRTPFSRGGDGKAALGPVLREYLMGEAMHGLGIATTRALAAVTTGDMIRRSAGLLPGAVLTRVAGSHVRVGTFQFFAARGETVKLRQLADYVIARHYPGLIGQECRYLALLEAVRDRQAGLIARWMLVGFIHGVMNTDNMALSGETIDYGPCAFLEGYDPATVFSSIDAHGRYAYGNQPLILGWNLARFAETLLPLLDADEGRAVELATQVIGHTGQVYQGFWLKGMREKLGLNGEQDDDLALAQDFLKILHSARADYTLSFRALAAAAEGDETVLGDLASGAGDWLVRWYARGHLGGAALRRANPLFIARNHRVEEALSAAVERGDLAPFERLLRVLARPFDEHPDAIDLTEPAPREVTAAYQTFCGT